MSGQPWNNHFPFVSMYLLSDFLISCPCARGRGRHDAHLPPRLMTPHERLMPSGRRHDMPLRSHVLLFSLFRFRFRHIKATIIGPLNHQSSTHSSTMRMSGLTSVSALLVVFALVGSINLAKVSMIQQLMDLASITYVCSLFSGQKLALLVKYRLLPVQLWKDSLLWAYQCRNPPCLWRITAL